MKYTAKDKQNLEGIHTLTNDPLATYQVTSGNKTQVKILAKHSKSS
jgi:hypothetical protein